MDKYLYFSLHTGEIYEVLEDEISTLNEFQVPLKCKPKSSCKNCYGRLHVGLNTLTQLYALCDSCSKKCIDWEKIKK